MLYLVLVAIVSLPLSVWSQIQIDRVYVSFTNIPVKHSISSPTYNSVTPEVNNYYYAADSFIVAGDQVSSTNISFRLDTNRKRLHAFMFSSYSETDLGRDRKEWTQSIATFDSIDLYLDGVVYRGKISGGKLAEVHVKILKGLWHEYGVGFTGEDSYKSDPTAFSDTSILEVTLSGPSPLVVDHLGGNDLVVYPNPATTELYVSYSEDLNEVAIFDMIGRKLQVLAISESKIDISYLAPGIYWLQTGAKMTKFCKR